MNNTLFSYCKLMRLDKPIGILLLLWPTLWALLLSGCTSISLFSVFILGVIFMRSAGCVINDFADRKLDKYVERTKNRPLTNGSISARNALVVFGILILLSFLLLLTLPPFTWLIAFFALLTTIIYPFMKRFTHLPQVVLGIAFSWSIPMVYAATIDSLPFTCWLLFIANISWTIAYDTEYAMVDRNDDLMIGIKSTAILFGQYDKLIISFLQILMLFLLLIIGVINQLSLYFYISLLIVVGLFIYQHRLITKRVRERCFAAFLNNNYVGLVILVGIMLSNF